MDKANKKILICDDSILARKNMTDTLRSFGYTQLIEVSNGEDAVTTFEKERPDLVLLDIVMPVKDGITATKEIMEIDSSATIVVVSSVGTQTHIKEVIKAGAKDFIQKPVDIAQFTQVLNHCFSK